MLLRTDFKKNDYARYKSFPSPHTWLYVFQKEKSAITYLLHIFFGRFYIHKLRKEDLKFK
jgi:hypothetical protein